MKTRFEVISTTKYVNQESVTFREVTNGSEHNVHRVIGELKIMIDNIDLFFVPGKEYYIDFTEAK